MLQSASIQPNYWFFPVVFSVGTVYYLAHKVIRNKQVWLILSFIIYVLWGESGILNEYNIFYYISDNIPIKVIENFFSIRGIPQYYFWYEFGANIFPTLTKYSELQEERPWLFHCIGFLSTIISGLLFLGKIREYAFLTFILSNSVTSILYTMFAALVISMSAIYFSIILKESARLNQIGQHATVFMGLEYITHSFFPLDLLPMINLGIPSLTTTIRVLTNTLLTLEFNRFLSKKIVRYFPILNGNRK